MKFLFIVSGTRNFPSSRVRVFQFLPYLQAHGLPFDVLNMRADGVGNQGLYRRWARRSLRLIQLCWYVLRADRYRVVFIQKYLPPVGLLFLLRYLNCNIIYDFDDAIFLLHQGQPRSGLRRLWHRVLQYRLSCVLRLSKQVIVSNDFLKEYAQAYNPQVVILPSVVNTDLHSPQPREVSADRPVVIGWIGTPLNSLYLKSLQKVFRALSEQYGDRIMIELVGSGPIHFEGVNVVTRNWSLDEEVDRLRHFDIGIMPLPDDLWSRGKAGYKLLLYMAVGLSCVASPVGVNVHLIQEGYNGFLARSDEEWIEKLGALVESPALRQRLGTRGRDCVVHKYSTSVIAPQWIQLLQSTAG